MEVFNMILGCFFMFFGMIGVISVCKKVSRFVGALIAKNPEAFKRAIDGQSTPASGS